MLKRAFDPKLVYWVVVYLRMSSDQQNKRSPEQQLAEIKRCLKALRLGWKIVKIYRDNAKSGRLLRKRRDYQQMMQDIKTGTVTVDLILVDTIERFGRVEELPTIRKELFEKHGVLVLTADTGFADPNTPQGKALGMFEAMRATEHGRILGHNVLRGKRDAIEQGHWPGGPAPFGLMLQSVMKEVDGRQEVDYCTLVHNPQTNWIIRLLFDKAYESGWGQTRLTRFLNEHPDIPKKFKPFLAPSVGYWLDNPIYSGELVWAQNCTGIVDDTRVVEPNTEEDIMRMPNFCEPTVPGEQQEAIRAVRRARSERILRARAPANASDGKLIEPPAPGLTLKYLLTGLVRCGHCGRAMTPGSSAPYITKSGEAKRYAAYFCPGAVAGICPNSKRVPEEWLREVVVGTARRRLFGPGDGDREPDWLAPLVEDVREALAVRVDHHPDQHAAYEQEMKQLQVKQAGWSQSLAKPDLAPSIRSAIEADWEKALTRQHEIEAALTELEHYQQRVEDILDPQQVLDRLDKLPQVLALNNPTSGNLELSLHIDRIDCFKDGRVVMRTCKLGALADARDLLKQDAGEPQQSSTRDLNGARMVTPRRRARLRADGGADVKATTNTVADPHRFAGLGEEWFWEDTFQIPEKTWPFQELAIEVATLRLAGRTHRELAEIFNVTVSTIRKALRYASEVDQRFRELPRKMPRNRWHEDHAHEVAAKKAEGLRMNELVALFGKSDTTIRKALEHARSASAPGTQAGEAGAA
jgi:DNA invertase Pin-like site-specific DNA recombinase